MSKWYNPGTRILKFTIAGKSYGILPGDSFGILDRYDYVIKKSKIQAIPYIEPEPEEIVYEITFSGFSCNDELAKLTPDGITIHKEGEEVFLQSDEEFVFEYRKPVAIINGEEVEIESEGCAFIADQQPIKRGRGRPKKVN
jgi:hypothetical protein